MDGRGINSLELLTQKLETDKQANEAAILNRTIDYPAYIREAMRIDRETRNANCLLAAQFVSDYLTGKQAEFRERMAKHG